MSGQHQPRDFERRIEYLDVIAFHESVGQPALQQRKALGALHDRGKREELLHGHAIALLDPQLTQYDRFVLGARGRRHLEGDMRAAFVDRPRQFALERAVTGGGDHHHFIFEQRSRGGPRRQLQRGRARRDDDIDRPPTEFAAVVDRNIDEAHAGFRRLASQEGCHLGSEKKGRVVRAGEDERVGGRGRIKFRGLQQ